MLKVEIPKPGGKGMRMLGIPTVVDRLIQQALHQVLSPHFEPYFSESSYGFRPQRSAHQGLLKARQYVREGRRWVVDIDLEKFFDRVNHDVLMSRLARRIKDKRVLRLIRRYLQAGIMSNGLTTARREGTPQGGPSHHCCRTFCSTSWTRSWNDAGTSSNELTHQKSTELGIVASIKKYSK